MIYDKPRHNRYTDRNTAWDKIGTPTTTRPGQRPRSDRNVRDTPSHDRDADRGDTTGTLPGRDDCDTNRHMTRTRPMTETRPGHFMTGTRHDPDQPKHAKDTEQSTTGTPTGVRQGRRSRHDLDSTRAGHRLARLFVAFPQIDQVSDGPQTWWLSFVPIVEQRLAESSV